MADSPSLSQQQRQQTARTLAEGRGSTLAPSLGLLDYTPEQQRQISRLPAYTGVRVSLQKSADGALKWRVNDDGTTHPGRYAVDSLGRPVELESGTMDSGSTTFDSGTMTMDAG